MTDEQYKNIISEIKVLNTKLKFVEDDLQEIKNLLTNRDVEPVNTAPRIAGVTRMEKF